MFDIKLTGSTNAKSVIPSTFQLTDLWDMVEISFVFLRWYLEAAFIFAEEISKVESTKLSKFSL